MDVQIFSPERLQQVIAESVPQDADPRGHVVIGTVDQDGAQVIASFKRSPESAWELQVAARHEWSGANSVGGRVLLRW